MEELLKKINGNLIEIKSKLDKDTFHISGGNGIIGQQKNFNFSSYTTYKPLKLGIEEFNIKITQQKSSNEDKKALKTGFVIGAIFLSFLVSANFTDIFFNGIISFLIFAVFFYFAFHIFLLIPFIVASKGTLKLGEEKMTFDFKKEKIDIDFTEIRSVRKEKNFFGYSFYIYKETDLYNTNSFHIESIDVSLAIEELINSKINESIKNFNMKSLKD